MPRAHPSPHHHRHPPPTAVATAAIAAAILAPRHNLAGTLWIPNTKIGPDAFANTKLARLDLSKATSP